ncbi:TELO2-interacting protein 2 isoform X2 [Festucalex cinctus]
MSAISRFLDELQLDDCNDEQPLPSLSFPPIVALLPELRRRLVADPGLPAERVGRLFRAADPHWLLDSGQEAAAEAYVSLVRALIGRAARVPRDGAAVVAALRDLLAKLQAAGPADRHARALTLAVAPHVCVFAITHAQADASTSPMWTPAYGGLPSQLLAAGGWRDSTHMLTGGGPEEQPGILEAVLDVLRPGLSREAWQRCEQVDSEAFLWTLLQVRRPFLAPRLSRLLGPALLLCDCHEAHRCMLGIRCLHHIVNNTAASELRALRQAEVMYEALFKRLHDSNADVVQLALACLLDLLAVLERPPSAEAAPPSGAAPRRHDDVLRLLLIRMEGEHKVALRRVYAQALPAYLQRMGVRACRHLARLSRVVPAYLEVSDAPDELSRMSALEALQQMLTAAWPRLACSVSVWLACLLRLLVDMWSEPRPRPDVARRLSRQATRCLALLDATDRHRLQLALEQVDASCCAPEVVSFLATVTMATEKSPSHRT